MRGLYESILSRKLSDPKRLVIEEWLEEYGVKKYTIKPNYEIDVDGYVSLYKKDIKEFPEYIQFGIVKGDFECEDNQLTSLRGCPRVVKGDFDCSDNNIESLEGGPEVVEGSFYCSYNKLISLKGAPKEVGGFFHCRCNSKQFTKKDVERVSKVEAEITVL